MPNAFEMLGVERDAAEPEVRAAYRRLARIYHPDRYANTTDDVREEAQRRMAELNSAFQAIKQGRGSSWWVDQAPPREAADAMDEVRAERVKRETMFRRWEEAERAARRRTAEAHDEILAGGSVEDTDDAVDPDDDDSPEISLRKEYQRYKARIAGAAQVWEDRNKRVDAEARAEAERLRLEAERKRTQIEAERAAWLEQTGQRPGQLKGNKKKRRGRFGKKA